MRILGPVSHGVIDYLMVILIAAGPTFAGFSGRQAVFCYLLAAVHLLVTIITRSPLGVTKTLPLPLHGAIEIVVAVLLVILPWLANFSAGVRSRNFFVAVGVLIGVIFLLTDYRSGGRASAKKTATP
jgi:hypothetical protein